MSKDEKISYQEQIQCASTDHDPLEYDNNMEMLIKWINTVLSAQCHVTSIKDLYSGYVLLKLLDITKPGCIEWKTVRSNQQIRHKFDRVNNCNIVIKVACDEFGFSLVSLQGSDIADGNYKIIQSLLLQLMRYYSTAKLSQLLSLPSKQSISDCDILQWINLSINECQYAHSKSLKSFKDNSLSTCIFYCELLKAVRPKHIDLSMVYYEVKPTAICNNATNKFLDKHNKHRLCNARYTICMIRRFGGEIFVTPHSLCNIEYKAVISVFASIMTIAMSDQQNIDQYNDNIFYE